MLQSLDHPNVIKAFDVFYNDSHERISTLMEFIPEAKSIATFVKENTDTETKSYESKIKPIVH